MNKYYHENGEGEVTGVASDTDGIFEMGMQKKRATPKDYPIRRTQCSPQLLYEDPMLVVNDSTPVHSFVDASIIPEWSV